MGLGTIIKVAILGESKGIHEAVKLANEDLEHLQKHAQTMGQKTTAFAKKFTAAAGAGALALAGVAIKAGDELNEAQDQFKNALENSGQHVRNLDKAISPLEKRMEKFGYTNEDVTKSLTQFTVSGVKLKDAMRYEGIAADLAKSKHIDLAAATTLVTKASQGQLKGLKALGIDLPVAAGGALKLKLANAGLVTAQQKLKAAEENRVAAIGKGNAIMAKALTLGLKGKALAQAKSKAEDQAATLAEAADAKVSAAKQNLFKAQQKVNDVSGAGNKILGALAKRMKGSAEESTKSLAGKTDALKAKFKDFTAHLGQKLIPILLKVGVFIGNLAEWFGRNKIALYILIAAIGLFVAAMVTLTIIDTVRKAQEAWNKAQVAFNAIMDANPIVLVVVAIAALAAGLYLAYKKVKWFHDAVDAVFSFLKTAVVGTIDFIREHWKLILAILTGPFGLVVLLIAGHISEIVGFIKDIPGRIARFASNLWGGITFSFAAAKQFVSDKVGDVVGFFRDMPGRIGRVIGKVTDVVTSPFRTAFNAIAGLWNRTVGRVSFSIPDWVPGIGGDGFSFPKMPTLHTGGIYTSGGRNGEGVALLKNGEGVFTPGQMRALGAGAFAGAGSGGSQVFNFPAGISPTAVAAAVRRRNARNGIT